MRLRDHVSSTRKRSIAVPPTGATAVIVAFCCVACGASPPNAAQTSAPSSQSVLSDQKTCERYESFSGRLVAGVPVESESPGLRPVRPGEVVETVPLPTLEDVNIEASPQTGSRVNFRISGDGIIGWTARFVQSPTLQQTSEVVSVLGSCVLQVDLTAVEYRTVGDNSDIPTRHTPVGDPQTLAEVLTYPSTNGLTQTFIGFRNTQPQVTVSDLAPEESTVVVTVR